jgi:hypothetical protein
VNTKCREIAALASNHGRIQALSGRQYECGSPQKNREAQLGTVMIKCPDTGRNIATGMVADRESFAATPVFFARVLCPLCRTEHEWFAKEAWVCEGAPAERAPLTLS